MKRIIIVIALLVLSMPTFASWYGTSSPWTQGNGTYYNPYRIESGEHLAYLADMVNAGVNDYQGQYFLLANDISLSNHSWTPIGDLTHKFRGDFDGGGHTIDSLMLELHSDSHYYGLFGNVADGEISNLTVHINTQFIAPTGSSYGYVRVGGIVCVAENESIVNCVTYGNVFEYLNSVTNFYPTAGPVAYSYAGGIVCKGTSNIQVLNCTNNCNVYARDAGGLIGQLEVDSTNTSIIEDCENNGNITGYLSCGGIVGRITGNVNIDRCSNNGSLRRKNYTGVDYGLYAGGIVGLFDIGYISSCNNKGNIIMKGSFPSHHHGYCSGIAGCISSESTIQYCYNRGNLTMTGGSSSSTNYVYFAGICYGHIGAIVNSCYNTGTMSLANGTVYGSAFQGNISNCYYKNDCGATAGGTPRSEANMKTAVFVTMLNADSAVYMMDANNVNGGYPIHVWTVFNVYTDSVSEIESNSARLWGHYEGTPSSMGFLLREANSGNAFTDLHYNFAVPSAVRTVDLAANTTYEFCFYADKNGSRKCGDTLTFHTLEATTDTTSGGGSSCDTVYVVVHDTLYVNNYIHDTTVVDNWIHDTTYLWRYDTTYINNYIQDTTVVDNWIYDTIYLWHYDTTYINNYIHDTIVVVNWMGDTNYLWQYDTIYINNYIHDTTVVDNWIYDTTYLWHYDTTYINNYIHDTTVVVDWLYDTVYQLLYDTTYVIDTLWLTQFDTVWLYDTVFIHDTVYIYDTVLVGVNNIAENNAKIYVSNHQIVVEGADGNQVALYDSIGRKLAVKQDFYEKLYFDVPATGCYLIRIGTNHIRKIVVIK